MARRIPVRGILRLRASGLSGNAIARTQSVSKTSVMDTFHAAVCSQIKVDTSGIGFST